MTVGQHWGKLQAALLASIGGSYKLHCWPALGEVTSCAAIEKCRNCVIRRFSASIGGSYKLRCHREMS